MAHIDLLQRLNAIVWEADADTLRFSFVTEMAATLLGFAVDDWIADENFFVKHLHQDDRKFMLALCHGVTVDGTDRQGDHRMVAADGRSVWFRTVVHGLRNGDGPVSGLLGMMVDISAQKKTEAAMHAAEERVRTVVNSAPILLLALDRQGMFTLCEGRALAAFNFRSGQIVGRSIYEVFRGEPAILTSVARALDGEAFTSVDHMRSRGIWWETSWSPLVDSSGALAGTTGVATNITDRKRGEEERAWLLEASRVLASSLEYEQTLTAIARLSLPLLGDWSLVDVLERDGAVRRVAVAQRDPAQAHLAEQLKRTGTRPRGAARPCGGVAQRAAGPGHRLAVFTRRSIRPIGGRDGDPMVHERPDDRPRRSIGRADVRLFARNHALRRRGAGAGAGSRRTCRSGD
jgi:PAS domain S-box-containing protein